MAQIVTVNAFHQGAGVSTLAANVAVVLAQRGRRVGLVDACVSAPTQQMLFDVSDSVLPPTFNDFLLGQCDLVDAARALPPDTLLLEHGELFLVPADSDWGKIQRALQAPSGVDVLGPGYHRLAQALRLDTLVIDSEAGLSDSALASIAVSDDVLAVVQLDQQYYKGLGIALGLAGHLDVPHRSLIINSVSPSLEPESVRQKMEQIYGWPVAGIVPYCDELSALCSSAIFVVRYPNHSVATIFRKIADSL